MVNRVDIEVSAFGNFSQIQTELTKLKASIAKLQSQPLLGTSGQETAKEIQNVQKRFDQMVLSTRAFNVEMVKMSDSVDKFGQNLEKGKLKLHDYFRIYRENSRGIKNELDDLAERQARIGKSVVIPDALKTGYSRVITSINADLKTLGATEDAVRIKAQGLNTVIRGMGTELVNLGKNTQWAGRQLTVGLTVPLSAFGAAAAKAFQDVDKELTRMAKVYGDGLTQTSDKTISEIRSQTLSLANELARTYGMAAQQTAAVAADLAATGLQGNDLLKATKETMRLSTLGELDQQSAIKATVALQRTFRLSTKDLSESINYLNAVENQTSTSLGDLVEGLPRAAVVVKQLGGSYKDLSAMMVAMREAGVPAAEAANSIKSAMASIINPSTKATESLKRFGIDIGDITTKNTGNLIGMITDLQSALDSVGGQNKVRLIEELFGKFQFAKVTALIDNLGKAGSQTQKAFQLAGASTTQLANLAEAELKRQTESVSGRYNRAIQDFKTKILPLGEQVTKWATTVMNVFNKFLDILNKFSPLKNLFVGLFGGLAVVGPILMMTGIMANLIGSIIKGANAFRMFKDGFKVGGLKEAFSSIQNFYENIDVSAMAAAQNTEQFGSNALNAVKAFEVLNLELVKLKERLTDLALHPITLNLKTNYANLSDEELHAINLYEKDSKQQGGERPHYTAKSDAMRLYQSSPSSYRHLQEIEQDYIAKHGPEEGARKFKQYFEEGQSAQYGMVQQGGAAALLQQRYGKENVIYGPKSGVTKEEIYTREVKRLVDIHDQIISGKIKDQELAAEQLTRILGTESKKGQALNASELSKLESIVAQVTFAEEQMEKAVVDNLVQQRAVLAASAESVEELNIEIKRIMTTGDAGSRAARVGAAWSNFLSTLSQEAIDEITTLRNTLSAYAGASTPQQTLMMARNVEARIARQAIQAGDIHAAQLGPGETMGAQRIRSALVAYTPSLPHKLQTGGSPWVPGHGDGDKVPAMLEPGEFVVNKKAAKQYGGFLHDINWNRAPRFQRGTGSSRDYIDFSGKPTFTHMQPNLSVVRDFLQYYVDNKSNKFAATVRQWLDVSKSDPNALQGFRFVGNMGLDLSSGINSGLNTSGKGIPVDYLIQDIRGRRMLGQDPYQEMLRRIGLGNRPDLSEIIHQNLMSSLYQRRGSFVNDSSLYGFIPGLIRSVLNDQGIDSNTISMLDNVAEIRSPRITGEYAESIIGQKQGSNTKVKRIWSSFLGRQYGGGIPGYETGGDIWGDGVKSHRASMWVGPRQEEDFGFKTRLPYSQHPFFSTEAEAEAYRTEFLSTPRGGSDKLDVKDIFRFINNPNSLKQLADDWQQGPKKIRNHPEKLQALLSFFSPIKQAMTLRRKTMLGLPGEIPANQQLTLMKALQSGDFESILGRRFNLSGQPSAYTEWSPAWLLSREFHDHPLKMRQAEDRISGSKSEIERFERFVANLQSPDKETAAFARDQLIRSNSMLKSVDDLTPENLEKLRQAKQSMLEMEIKSQKALSPMGMKPFDVIIQRLFKPGTSMLDVSAANPNAKYRGAKLMEREWLTGPGRPMLDSISQAWVPPSQYLGAKHLYPEWVKTLPYVLNMKQSGGLISSLKQIFPGIMSSLGGVNDVNEFAGLDSNSGMFLKQISNLRGINVEAMAHEAVMSQLFRSGLFGENVTGPDQSLFSARSKKGGLKPVLGSKMISGLLSGMGLLNSKGDVKSQLLKGNTMLDLWLSSAILGNKDMHVENFGIARGKGVAIDNTSNFFTDAHGNSLNLRRSLNDFEAYSNLDEIGRLITEKRGESSVEKYGYGYLEGVLGRLGSGTHVADSILRATNGSPDAMSMLDKFASRKTQGKYTSYADLLHAMIEKRTSALWSGFSPMEEDSLVFDNPRMKLQMGGGIQHRMPGGVINPVPLIESINLLMRLIHNDPSILKSLKIPGELAGAGFGGLLMKELYQTTMPKISRFMRPKDPTCGDSGGITQAGLPCRNLVSRVGQRCRFHTQEFQQGGSPWVPGSGDGDRVPAMLEPGEFVVNKNAAKQYGGLLHHLNWNAAPRFATGGRFGALPKSILDFAKTGKLSDPYQTSGGASRGVRRDFDPSALPLIQAQVTAGLSMIADTLKAGASKIGDGLSDINDKGVNRLKLAVDNTKYNISSFQDSLMEGSKGVKSGGKDFASGLLGKAKDSFAKGPGIGSMIGAQFGGMAISTAASKMQPGMGQSALSGAAAGLQMGAALGPYGMVAGAAIGGIFGAISKHISDGKEKARIAAAGLKDAISPSAIALDNLGIKVGSFADVVIKAGKESDKAATKIQKIADAYKSSGDETVIAALKNIGDLLKEGKTGEITRLSRLKYSSEILSGADPKKAKEDLAGYLQGAGVGAFTSANIVSQVSKNVSPDKALSSIIGNLGSRSIAPDLPTKFVTGTRGSNSQQKGNWTRDAVAKANYKTLGESLATQALSSNPEQLGRSISGLSELQRVAVNSKSAFKAFNAEVEKSDPALAKLNLSMKHSGAAGSNIVRVNSLMVHGMKMTAAEAKALALDTVALAAAEHKLSEQMHMVTATQAMMDKATAKDLASSLASTQGTQNAINSKQKQIDAIQDYINKQQKLINAIDKEKAARDKAFQSSQQQISNEKTLADLQAGITRAGASGDLISMAKAQSDYNAELAKQADQKKKDAADAVDDKRISAIQARIEKANDKIAELNKQMSKMQQAAANAVAPIVKESHKAQQAVEGIQTRMKTLLDSNSYTTKDEFYNLIKGDKGIQGYMKTAGLSADDLSASIGKIWKSDGKTNAKLNADLADSAKAMGNFGTQTEKAMMMKRAFNLMLAHPNWTADKALSQAEEEAVTAAKVKGLKEGKKTVTVNGKSIPVGGAATGGYITGAGTATSDSIPAMLSNGEYVIKASSVGKYGVDMLHAINNGTFGPRYATGGLVKNYSIGDKGSNSSLSSNAVYNINVSVDTNANPDEIANKIMRTIQREQRSMSTGRSMGGF